MRAITILLVAVLAAIGIGVGVEAGNIASGPQATFSGGIGSLDASPTIEIDLAVTVPGTTPAISEVEAGTLEIDLATLDGQPLRGARAVDAQISLFERSADLADVRIDGRQVYVRVAFAAIERLPGVPASDRGTLSTLGGLFGGTWFSLPANLFGGLTNAIAKRSATPPPSPAEQAQIRAASVRYENDLLEIAHFSQAATPSGTAATVSASLDDLVRVSLDDLGPVMAAISPLLGGELATERSQLAKVHGTLSTEIVTDGAGTMRAARLSVTSLGKTETVVSTIAHGPVDLAAPSGARALPPAILRPLEAGLEQELLGHQVQ